MAETATRIASSLASARLHGPLPRRTALPASPSSDSPAGRPTAMITTRMLCTIAIERSSAPSSAATTSTCDSPPGDDAR